MANLRRKESAEQGFVMKYVWLLNLRWRNRVSTSRKDTAPARQERGDEIRDATGVRWNAANAFGIDKATAYKRQRRLFQLHLSYQNPKTNSRGESALEVTNADARTQLVISALLKRVGRLFGLNVRDCGGITDTIIA